jgi:ABC-2 type transport system ATP-binding protein
MIIARGRVLADGTPAELEARSRYHNAVRLSLPAATLAAAHEQLRGLPYVADVEEIDDVEGHGLLVVPQEGGPIVSEIGDLVRANRWEASLIRVERGRLDDVFREITRGQPAAVSTPVAAE